MFFHKTDLRNSLLTPVGRHVAVWITNKGVPLVFLSRHICGGIFFKWWHRHTRHSWCCNPPCWWTSNVHRPTNQFKEQSHAIQSHLRRLNGIVIPALSPLWSIPPCFTQNEIAFLPHDHASASGVEALQRLQVHIQERQLKREPRDKLCFKYAARPP